MKFHALHKSLVLAIVGLLITALEHEKSFLLQGGSSNVLAIGLYRDSLLVAVSNDIVQRDIKTGVLQRTFRAHDQTVYAFVVTNDSRMISSAFDDMIVVWDLVTGSISKRIRLRVSETRIVSLVVINYLVIGGGDDFKVRQIDLVSGTIIRTTDFDSYVYSITIDGEYFYVGKDTAPYIQRYLIQGGTANLILEGHSDAVLSIFLSENTLVSGSKDSSVICWNARGGSILQIFSGPPDEIYAVGLFEGFVYSAGSRGVVYKWNMDSGDISKTFPLIHANSIKAFAFSLSELFTGSIDTTVVRWDTASGDSLFRYSGRNKKFRAVAAWKTFVMSAGEDIEINIWDASVNSAEPIIVLSNHMGPINELAIYDDFLYSGSSDRRVNQWNLTNNELIKVFEGYPRQIISLAADQYFVYASGTARVIFQWNVSSGILFGSFEGHTDDVYTVKLSSNLLVSGSIDETARAWNVQLRETLNIFNAADPINDLVVEGDLLVAGTFDGVQSFSLASGVPLVVMQEMLYCSAITSYINRVFTGHNDGIIRVRDLNTLTILEMYQGHSDIISGLCFDSSFSLYSAGFDGSIKKWNMATRRVAYSYENRGSSVSALAASGKLLYVGLRGGEINSFNIDEASVVDAVSMNEQFVSSLLASNGSVYGSNLGGILVKFPSSLPRNVSTIYTSRNEPLRSLALNSKFLIVLAGENKAVFFSNDQVAKTVDLQTSIVCMTATEDSLLGGSRSGVLFSWSLETFALEFELKGHLAPINDILVVGSRLFSASDDKTIIEWSLDDRDSVKVYQRLSANALGHLGPVNALSYCSGSLFSAGSDLSIRRWNTQTGRHEDVYFGFSKALTTVLCHNRSIYAGSEDFSVLMFRPLLSNVLQTSTSSRSLILSRGSRRRRTIQNSQSVGFNNSSLLPSVIGAAASIIVLILLISFRMYRKLSERKHTPIISTVSELESTSTITDLRTFVNSVMGISKHASYLIPSSIIARVRKLTSGGGGELLIAKIMDPALQKKFGDTVIQKLVFTRNTSTEEAFYQEVGIMIMLSSFPHFCQIIGYTEKPLSLILKFYPEGSLSEWLHKSKEGPKFDVKLLRELGEALITMHSRYLAHCDIKPENVLIQIDGAVPSCYLTDFGITQILSDEILASKVFNIINLRGLSVHYAAPEAFTNLKSKKYVQVDYKKYDIYSLGCVIFEFITRKVPWK